MIKRRAPLMEAVSLAVVAAVGCALVAPTAAAASPDPRGDIRPVPRPAVITLQTVGIGKPGNASAGIVPFSDAIYPSCANVAKCMPVGGVAYRYGVGRLETTVKQYVAFLNTVNADGTDPHRLYSFEESSTAWPKYGQINFSATAPPGQHYTVSYPQWADKPYGFADFLRAARFVNSMQNGTVLSKTTTKLGAVAVTTYQVRLSRQTERGMYDMAARKATRASKFGFVIPSQNEWIKSAYFDPKGGGTYSYWKYPTNAGVFGQGTTDGPTSSILNPGNGNITNAATQPLATDLVPDTKPPTWCPAQYRPISQCNVKNPLGLGPLLYKKLYKASLSTVGQARTLSPWGTLDQGGNAVEWTDTITPAPTGTPSARVWRRLHGGVPNSTAYQLWISAVGLQPQDNAFFERTYPWLGFRIGTIGGR